MSNKTGAWIQRIPKDDKTKDADFYQTPLPCTFALLDYLESQGVPRSASVIDPCSGAGAISSVLKTYFTDVTEIDKYSLPVSTDFLTYMPEKKFDILICNPPFFRKYDFIDHAMKVADIVIVLLPGLAENYIKVCEKYKDVDAYAGKVTCYPKMFMDQNIEKDGKIKQGGTTTYSWLLWNTVAKRGESKFEVMKDVRKYYGEVKEFAKGREW